MLRKKEQLAADASGASTVASGGSWSKPYPTLVEFLCLLKWEDGSSRQTGSLTLFTEGSAWKFSVKDKANKLCAFMSAASPQELLSALEKGLAEDTLDWRPDAFQQPAKRRTS